MYATHDRLLQVYAYTVLTISCYMQVYMYVSIILSLRVITFSGSNAVFDGVGVLLADLCCEEVSS